MAASPNQLSDLICVLAPVNAAATQIVNDNLQSNRAGRVVPVYDGLNGLAIYLEEPNRKGDTLLFIGRNTRCGIQTKSRNFSGRHGSIAINPTSGELLIRQFSSVNIMRLNQEAVTNPPQRALVRGKDGILCLGTAVFHIIWPKVPEDSIREYRHRMIAAAAEMRENDEFDLTDLEWNINSLAPTRVGTPAPPSPFLCVTDPDSGPSPIQLELLGRGAFGEVHLAVEKYTASFVAVKKVQLNKGNLTATQREIDLLCQLKHPNIVRMVRWRSPSSSGACVEIDLEYCQQGNLRNHLVQARRELRSVFWQLLSALEYLHAQKIIHRDIKPENILIVFDELTIIPKLADFGLANHANNAETVAGTTFYMAPEIMHGKSQTSKVDIFSLGIVLLEILGYLEDVSAEISLQHKIVDQWYKLQRAISSRADRFLGDHPDCILLNNMISQYPESRPEAAECLQYLGEGNKRRSQDTSGALNHCMGLKPERRRLHLAPQVCHPAANKKQPAEKLLLPVRGQYPRGNRLRLCHKPPTRRIPSPKPMPLQINLNPELGRQKIRQLPPLPKTPALQQKGRPSRRALPNNPIKMAGTMKVEKVASRRTPVRKRRKMPGGWPSMSLGID